jgi:putative membrane protein
VTIRWLFAAAHLLALGIGLGAVYARARALRGPLDKAGLNQVFLADTWWGVAGFLWIATGLVRLFAGLEKGTSYYVQNHFFWMKMALLVVILALEIPAVRTFVQWRTTIRKGGQPDTRLAGRFATTSTIQLWVTLAMVLLATGMARGMGVIAR